MTNHPQQHLEILQIPMEVLAMDTVSHLPISSKCNRWGLTAICLAMFYMFAVPMKETSAENEVQAYLSGIISCKGGSVAILSDNGTEFKNKVLNDIYDLLGMKPLFSNPFHPQGNAQVENVHNVLIRTLTKFLTIVVSGRIKSLYLLVIAITYFQAAMAMNLHSSLCLDKTQQKDTCFTLRKTIGIMAPIKGK